MNTSAMAGRFKPVTAMVLLMWLLDAVQAFPILKAMEMQQQHRMNMNHSSGGHTMKMYFHSSSHATILFQQWHTMTWGQLIGSCFIVGVFAVFYEGFKVLREVIQYKLGNKRSCQSCISPESKDLPPVEAISVRARVLNKLHLAQTGLHVLQTVFSYCLMLIFMTYNVWLCLAVTLGAGIGYFCFGWRKNQLNDCNEHCN